jgi:ADP-heptose:LPS heptosyltransferase
MLSVLFEWPPAAAVIRTDGIGDALLFEPALEELARTISPTEVHLWAPAPACELMQACPTVRRRFVVPRGFKDGNLLLFRSLWQRARLGYLLGFRRYDLVLYPAESPEPLGNWLFSSIRAKNRWINSGDTIHQFDSQRADAHARATRVLETRPGSAHELLRNAYLGTQWGGSLELRPPRLFLTAKAIHQADRQMSIWREMERRVGASSIVMVIPAGSQPINRYPADQWLAALGRLWHEHRAVPALVGGPAEERFIQSITRRLGDVPFLRPDGRIPLLGTAALAARVDAVLSVDTGLAHLAVAQHVPNVILRIGGDPGRFFPWPDAHRSVVLFKTMACEGCHNRCHLPQAECIAGITPDQIVEAFAKLAVTRVQPEYATSGARWLLKVAG